MAGRVVDRRPVRLDFASSDLVRFDGRAMRFGNVNGEDILIYPGVAIMPRADGAFALIDLRELRLGNSYVHFTETETVPHDAQIVGNTWLKAKRTTRPITDSTTTARSRSVGAMLDAHIIADRARGLVRYDRMIFGHFIEHFHTQVYGGIYCPGSPLAEDRGFRTDVIEALRDIKLPIMRWPGGNFVSDYHWRDAVGRGRSPNYNMAWRVPEPNRH